jgi:hypothetical protein
MASGTPLIIDGFRHGGLHAAIGSDWRVMTDTVMGGISD